MSSPLAATDLRGGLITIELRHLAVHQYDAIREDLEHLHRLLAVGGDVYSAT